jgi:hypothetical protein
MVFDSDLQPLAEREIGSMTAFAYCGETLAIATASTTGTAAAVTLYQNNLVPTDGEVQLTAHMTSRVYLASTMELFAGTRNGAVLKWIVDLNNPFRFLFTFSQMPIETIVHWFSSSHLFSSTQTQHRSRFKLGL